MHHSSRGTNIMQNHRILSHKPSLKVNGQFGSKTSIIHADRAKSFPLKKTLHLRNSRATISSSAKQCVTSCRVLRYIGVKCVPGLNFEEISDEEDDLCPVECVKEFYTDDEFLRILEKSKETKSLVVVDFYRTACGSCNYVEQIFTKLCKGSGNEDAAVIFLKHNVIDDYDEQSEVAERLRIKVVPLFHFYKDGVLLEAFPTRDKEKIIAAIHKYTSIPQND